MLISLLFVGTSCVKQEFDEPPIKTNTVDFQANTTITALKALYTGLAYQEITTDVILETTVTANDAAGNYYKSIIVQDATAGIELKINLTELHNDYPVGQKLFIKCKGLFLGSYGGVTQLGSTYEDSGETRFGGIDSEVVVNEHLFKADGGTALQPTVLTINALSDSDIGKLITLEDVQFATSENGKDWADAANHRTENRNLTDCNGNSIIVRTSGYADFAGETLPDKNGSITAILSKYNNDYQLYVRDLNDINMTADRCTGGGTGTGNGTGTEADPYDVAAAISNNTPAGVWVTGFIVGVYETKDAAGDINPFVESFAAPFYTNSNMLIAATADETNLNNCLIVQLPFGDIRDALNLVDDAAKLSVEVKVHGDLMAYFGQAGMKNTNGYKIAGVGIDPPPPLEGIIAEDFSGTEENASVAIENWLNYVEAGTRDWIGKSYSGEKYAQFSAFSSGEDSNIGWLITPSIDFDAQANEVLTFVTKSGYYKHDGLTVWVSTNFDGTNVTAATWTQLTATIATGDSGGYSDWIASGDVDLSSYTGTGYIAFKYTGNTTSQTTTFQLDKVLVKSSSK